MKMVLIAIIAAFCSLLVVRGGPLPEAGETYYKLISAPIRTNEAVVVVTLLQVSNNIHRVSGTFSDLPSLRSHLKSLPKGSRLYYGIEGLPENLRIGTEIVDTRKLRTEFEGYGVRLMSWPGF